MPAAQPSDPMNALPDRDPLPLTADSSVGAVIAEFVVATDPDRDLRSALSHVDAELGTMPVRSVRTRHLATLLDDLRGAGLNSRRETAIVGALEALFAFAVARGLVAVSPIAAPPRRAPDFAAEVPPRRAPDFAAEVPPRRAPEFSAEAPRTPTLTMLALGARVAWWTSVIVTLVFVVLLLALLVELA
jgi:hypothetical protein